MSIYVGLIGKNISYSISPLIYNYWFKVYGINALYNKLDISNNILSENYIKSLLKDNYIGFNITTPYKEVITYLFNTEDKIVNNFKTANTLYIKDNRIFLGNTDYLGFLISLIIQKNSKQFFENNSININKILKKFSLNSYNKKFDIFTNNSNALIVGAGGVTKAVVYSLIRSNINKIFILNRSIDNALQISKLFNNNRINVIKDLNEINNIILLVNCTPLESGFYLNNKFNHILKKECLFFDLTYNPVKTKFLDKAYKEGYETLNGLLMLIIQAAFSFEKWFNIFPKIDKKLLDLTKKELTKFNENYRNHW